MSKPSETEVTKQAAGTGAWDHIPVGVPEGHITASAFAIKYGLPQRRVVTACAKKSLQSEVRRLPTKIAGKYTKRWFVLDVSPSDHPFWAQHEQSITKKIKKKATKAIVKKFDEWAPILLDNYDMRGNLDQTVFSTTELAKILEISRPTMTYLLEIGIKGYGKLPRASININQVDTKEADQRSNMFIENKDIRRFLKKELLDPAKKIKITDDRINKDNRDDIVASQGYYVYDPLTVYDPTLEGFLAWTKKNIFFYNRKTRKNDITFVPTDKQIDVYKNVFELNSDGYFKKRIIGICRPRGDYKTFDAALLVMFRFFNFQYEYIYLVTNSVQQTSHLVYREIAQIIKRSPGLSDMLNTPALDIQRDSMYLRTGKGEENIFNSIQIISAEGGARSNATCFAWSEAWKYNGDEINVAEIEQSIRGVDNAWFIAESTVAPKGHFFQRYYEDSLTGENEVLYFQYYDGSERRNPKVDNKQLNHIKRVWGLFWKMFFWNRWEDASVGVFPEARIIEMGHLGVDGAISSDNKITVVTDKLADLSKEIRKLEAGVDVQALRKERAALLSTLTRVDQYYDDVFPATAELIYKLGEIYGCDFFIGIGIDRAKHIQSKAGRNVPDRTVIATVARGLLDIERWGIDRIFFLLNLTINTELHFKGILNTIHTDANTYAGGFANIDIEDYNAIDLYEECRDVYGSEAVEISPTSIKHQEAIFTEFDLALGGGYFKAPHLDIWTNERSEVIYSRPGLGTFDILRDELNVFEAHISLQGKGRGSKGFYGTKYKIKNGQTGEGEAKDDTVFAIAYAIHASIRGDIPASLLYTQFPTTEINTDTIADPESYGLRIY